MTDIQFLPALDPFDLGKLRESIKEHGVREPIVVDEFGRIIDGFNRKSIATEFGLDCPERTVSGLTEPEKRSYAITLNAARRQLTVEQRRQVWGSNRLLVKAALVADATRSDRAIAEEIGVDGKTVAKVREELESNADIRILERRGRGDPEEIPAENMADHRNEVYIELTIGYPCPSDEIRKRTDDPYPQASDRLTWPSGRLYLTAAAPRNDAQAATMLAEAFHSVAREMTIRPMKTMVRGLA